MAVCRIAIINVDQTASAWRHQTTISQDVARQLSFDFLIAGVFAGLFFFLVSSVNVNISLKRLEKLVKTYHVLL